MKVILSAIGTAMFVALIMATVYVYKTSQIWSAEINGKAIMAEAEFSKKARVMEAQAKLDAATLEGQAELTKAEFAAKANAALAEGLGGSEGYLRYLYIRMLEEQGNSGKTIIYIPTEAGVPILEANRMKGANE